jgi:predicted small secreted protein
VRRAAAVVTAVALCAVGVAGCRNVRGVGQTRRSLEQAGYRDVEVSFRSGGGIDLVRVDASRPPGTGQPDRPPDEAAGAVWRTLPLRFDRLRVSVHGPSGTVGRVYDHAELVALFGPRQPGLDRRQVGDAVVTSGLKLFAALSVAAILSVGLVVAMVVLVVRTTRRARRRPTGDHQAGDDQDGEEPSAGLGVPGEADGPEAMPS